MFTDQTIGEIAAVAKATGIEPAALLAVSEIESGGTAFVMIDGKAEPVICFEGHYFDRRLSTAKRKIAREQGLSSPVAGEIANPRSQVARWSMITRAAEIDRKAAYESVSWGIGQVMGAHWAWLGYADAEALANEVRESVAGQVRLMARYIDKAGLTASLAAHDWHAFARGYNGPNYRQYGYHSKLAAAYKRHARTTVAIAGDKIASNASQATVGTPTTGCSAKTGIWTSLKALFHPAL